jgi:hypothetical protein
MDDLIDIKIAVNRLQYKVVQRLYEQICIHLKNNDWNLIRTKSYWKEKDEASTEFEKRKVTLVYFALNKDKLDDDTLDKIHNDYADYKYLKNISVSKNVRHTRFNK